MGGKKEEEEENFNINTFCCFWGYCCGITYIHVFMSKCVVVISTYIIYILLTYLLTYLLITMMLFLKFC